jgi:ABC-type branched-subunit amino acid transport system permease subunit
MHYAFHYSDQQDAPDIADFFRSVELVVMIILDGMASAFGAVIGSPGRHSR